MEKYSELYKLNQEIELLERAGLIKESSILHKKFLKEAQVSIADQNLTRNTNQVPAPQGNSTLNTQVVPNAQVAPTSVETPPSKTNDPSNPYSNYYLDPRTGKPIFIDPGTGQPYTDTRGVGIPGQVMIGTTPVPVEQLPPPTPTPAPAPGNTPPAIDLGIPSFKDRFDFYYGKIDQGFNIQDPQQQQEYFKRLKEQILNQLLFGLIDQKTYNDLMRLFAR